MSGEYSELEALPLVVNKVQPNTQSLAPQEGCHNECLPGLLGRKFIVVY